MTQIKSFTISAVMLMVAALLTLPLLVTAEPNPPAQYPYTTPDPANVIVIPPTPGSRIDEILNDPAVLIPAATPFNATVPQGFLQPGDTVLVIAQALNVRTNPIQGPEGAIIGTLQRGDDLTVLQLSADLGWALVDTRGPQFLTGWVSTQYVEKLENFQPFAPSLPDESGTGLYLKAQQTVNIRSRPVLFSDRVGILAEDALAEIIGRKGTYNWWKIRVDGTVGWVAADYIYVIDAEAYQVAPILTE